MTEAPRAAFYESEIRFFFQMARALSAARRAAEPTDEFFDEIGSIAMHTEQPALRVRARAILGDTQNALAGPMLWPTYKPKNTLKGRGFSLVMAVPIGVSFCATFDA